jgi:ATP phosphoribosyltransferase
VKWFDGKKIATSYPNILRKFAEEQGINIEVHVIQGSVEIAPGIGLSDGIFDIVSSGSTLISNKLREVETVMKSEALLIGNKELTPEKQATLDDFLFRIQSVLVADDKKYVLMNAPTDKVKDICSILPGIKSPTVLPLATDGWTSIHTVVDQKHFWEIVGQLKEKGAEGILVLPIEKMIL